MKDLFHGIDAINFGKRFTYNYDCYQYLYDIKWSKGYRCIRCGSTDDVKGGLDFTEDASIAAMMKV
jgi:hypothetical protein